MVPRDGRGKIVGHKIRSFPKGRVNALPFSSFSASAVPDGAPASWDLGRQIFGGSKRIAALWSERPGKTVDRWGACTQSVGSLFPWPARWLCGRIHQLTHSPEVTSTLIQQASRWALPRETAVGAARRCAFRAQQINAICAVNPSAHILAVACGKFREAALSAAVQYRFFGRLVGVDHSEQALAEVSQNFGPLGVETIRGSGQTIMSWSRDLDRFDFIYSDGLYEGFDERFCRRLTRMLFEMLRPGGRLLAGNLLSFSKGGHSASRPGGSPVYGRTPSTMQRLAADIPSHWLGAMHAFVAPCQTAVYLDLFRRP